MEWRVEARFFFTQQPLEEIREECLNRGVVPRISVGGKNLDIKRLSAQGDLEEAAAASTAPTARRGPPGRTVIYRVPDELNDIRTFLSNLDAKGVKVEYRGESMPAIYHKALLKILAVKRKQPSKNSGGTLGESWGEVPNLRLPLRPLNCPS